MTFRRYTGQESEEQREEIRNNPPDILLTNYVMLEYLLTRPVDGAVIRAAQGLPFLVLDELHTYRGRQGADVALLVRRVRERCQADESALRRHVGHDGRAGHVRRAAGRGRARRRAACSAHRSSRATSSARRCARRPVDVDLDDAAFRSALAERVRRRRAAGQLRRDGRRPAGVAGSSARSASRGTRRDERYRRCVPRPLRGEDGAAAALAQRATGVDLERCTRARCRTR